MERQTKNTREATKTLRDRLKEENKKFDGTDMFGMVLFIIVAEEVMENYNVGDNADSDMQSPDEVTVMFNNLVGPARDWVRTQRETAPNVMRSPRVFKDVLMAKYFGNDTPFEGLAPLYKVKQRENQTAKEFSTTLTMLGIYLGRRQSALIPKKKKCLSEKKFAQQDGLLNLAQEKPSSSKFRYFDFYDFITSDYFEGIHRYFNGGAEYPPWFNLATAKV